MDVLMLFSSEEFREACKEYLPTIVATGVGIGAGATAATRVLVGAIGTA